jgi:predicted nuclease of predicted toxin-antitoxin system
VKFLLDENLSRRQASRLRDNGHDAVAVVEESLGGASDLVVRSAAISSKRILVTLDADFGNIIRYPPQGTPGIIWLRLHPPTESKIGQALDRCLDKLGKNDLTGKLVVVDEDKIRVRG